MSQAAPAPAQTGTSLPKSFLRTPANPYSEKGRSASEALTTPPGTPPITSLAPANPPAATDPAPNPATPPTAGQAPQSTAPTSAPPEPPLPATGQTQFTPLSQPQYDPLQVQQVVAERDRLAQEAEQMKAMIHNLSQSQQELEAIKRQQAMQTATIPDELFDKLESIEHDDAKALSKAVLDAAMAPVNAMRDDLEAQRKQLAAQAEAVAREQQKLRIQQLTADVKRVHPDFDELQHTQEYQEFMKQRDGLSSQTRDQRAAEEFLKGNTAYVIDVLNQLKGQKPQVQNITTVAPVQSASGVAAEPQPAAPQMTLHDLNTLYQMRQITHDQYREELNKLRAAGGIGV